MAIFLALINAEVNIPYSHSLKEKRAVMRPIKDKLRNRLNVSVIENGYQDEKTRGSLLIAGIAEGRRGVDSTVSSIINFMESNFHNLDISFDENVIQIN